MKSQTDVVFFVKNHIGLIKLNRKNALNALSLNMIDQIQKHLHIWEEDKDVYAIYISSALNHVFCAGGDVKSLYEHHVSGDDQYPALYLAKQYLMDYHMHTYKKPIIVYVDGFVFGGGVGLVTAAKYLVVSENVKMAMPETKIGFFPDVGTSRLLNDLPNQIGRYMGLLGVSMNAADTIDLKIAQYMVPSKNWKHLENMLETICFEHNNMDEALKKMCMTYEEIPQKKSVFMHHTDQIKRIFSKENINEMVLEINKHDPFELDILDRINEMSPTALFVTQKLLKETQNLSLYECFKYEHSLSRNVIKTHDFKEGVRSLLIDKDKKFDYQPQEINKVILSHINEIFNFESITENHIMDQMKGSDER